MTQSNEPKDWKVGTAAAREARAVVAEQLAELILERDMTGGRDHFAQRLRELLEAERRGEPEVQRAAAMELAVAAAGWVVSLDLRQRPFSGQSGC